MFDEMVDRLGMMLQKAQASGVKSSFPQEADEGKDALSGADFSSDASEALEGLPGRKSRALHEADGGKDALKVSPS